MLSKPNFSDEFFGTTLKIPGKTFLLGEYGALMGEPALLCATGPQFKVRPQGQNELSGIHPESPAGTLWRESACSFGIEFIDPYNGVGGFGASGAQFLAVYTLIEFHKSGRRLGASGWVDLLKSYKKIVDPQGGKLKPSGADLVAQLIGGVCYFDAQKKVVECTSWPFKDLEFVLFKTQGKTPTHEHIKRLSSDQVQGLGVISDRGWGALKRSSRTEFVKAIRAMNEALLERGFVSHEEILSELEGTGLILAGKGCGALGADVLAVFCRPEDVETVVQKGTALALKPIATQRDLSAGLSWE